MSITPDASPPSVLRPALAWRSSFAAARLVRRYPEWWGVLLSALAWLLLFVQERHTVASLAGPVPFHQHAHGAVAASPQWRVTLWLDETAGWMLMVVAMMVPLVLGSLRATAARSVWRRRDRAMAAFLAGYASQWLLAGLLASLIVSFVRLDARASPPAIVAGGFAVAAAWQLAPAKWRALWACHRTVPLAPAGWQADRNCFCFGRLIGGRCVLSCWAMMLACLLAGHNVAAMASTGAIAAVERYAREPRQRLTGGVLVGMALLYASTPLR